MYATISKTNKIELRFGYLPALLNQVKSLPGRSWSKAKRCWVVPQIPENIQFVLDKGFKMTPADAQVMLVTLDREIKHRSLVQQRRVLCNALAAPPIPEVERLFLKGVEAKPFQWVSCHYARLNDSRFILGDDMGSGKSVQALMIAHLPEHVQQPVLIITPVPATFAGELYKFFGESSILVDKPLHGLNPNVRFYFCTYENLKHLFKDATPDNLVPYACTKNMLIICDESQKLKNRDTKRFKLTEALSTQVKHFIQMTGTPIMNREQEAYAQLLLWRPSFMSYTQFLEKYCGQVYSHQEQSYVAGNRNLPALNQFLYDNCFMRREQAQIMPQLPKKLRQIVTLKDKPLNLIADSMFELYALNADRKILDPDFLDWLENALDSISGKVLIFGHHQIMLDGLEIICRQKGLKHIRIDGSTPQVKRHELEKQFNADKDMKVAVLSIGAAGHGLNLQSANVVIFAEFCWTPGQILQGEARSMRMGQENEVLVLFPRISRFENRLVDLLLEKIVTINKTVSTEASIVNQSETSLLRELSKEFGIPFLEKK